MTKELSAMGYREQQAYHAQLRDSLMVGDEITSVFSGSFSAPYPEDSGRTILRRTATLLIYGIKCPDGIREYPVRISDGLEPGAAKFTSHTFYAANDKYVLQLREERTAKLKFQKLSVDLENAINKCNNEQQLREAVARILNPPAPVENTPVINA